MTAPIDGATVDALALADLGQKVLNAISLTKVLGLATVQSAVGTYAHSREPAAQLVAAVLAGQIDAIDTALTRWIEAKPAIANAYLEHLPDA